MWFHWIGKWMEQINSIQYFRLLTHQHFVCHILPLISRILVIFNAKSINANKSVQPFWSSPANLTVQSDFSIHCAHIPTFRILFGVLDTHTHSSSSALAPIGSIQFKLWIHIHGNGVAGADVNVSHFCGSKWKVTSLSAYRTQNICILIGCAGYTMASHDARSHKQRK